MKNLAISGLLVIFLASSAMPTVDGQGGQNDPEVPRHASAHAMLTYNNEEGVTLNSVEWDEPLPTPANGITRSVSRPSGTTSSLQVDLNAYRGSVGTSENTSTYAVEMTGSGDDPNYMISAHVCGVADGVPTHASSHATEAGRVEENNGVSGNTIQTMTYNDNTPQPLDVHIDQGTTEYTGYELYVKSYVGANP